MATNSVLAKLAVIISAQTAEFNKNIASTQKNLQSFTNNIIGLSKTLGVAFGVREVADFALEVSKLAGEAEGVRAAFERLPNSTKLMDDLKRATGNTVSELDLMKRAVQANNFEISLAALPRLLEFATLRAQQTGQSVDYLVDSIVTGIGRKSKLILDNLGISAVQLNEALGGASTAASTIGEVADAVGKIAEDNLKNMAGFSDNASTRLQKLEASWVNVKVAIGDAANGTGILGTALEILGDHLDVLASRRIPNYLKVLNLMQFGAHSAALAQIELIQKQIQINNEQEKQDQIVREVDRAYKEFNGDIDAYGRAITTHIYKTELLAEFTKRLTEETDDNITTLEELKAVLDDLNTQFDQTDINDQKKLKNIAAQIMATEAQIKALEDLKKVQEDTRGKRKTPDLLLDTKRNGRDFLADSKLGTMSVNGEISESLDKMTESFDKNKTSVESWAESMNISRTMAEEEFSRMADVAQTAGTAIGEVFGNLLTGQQDFATGLANVTGQIIELYLKQSLAAMIAAAIKDPSTPFPLAKIAMAGIGLGLVRSLFSQIGGSGAGGSGGGGAPGYLPSQSRGSDFNVNIRGRTRGSDLVYTTEKEGYRRSRVG